MREYMVPEEESVKPVDNAGEEETEPKLMDRRELLSAGAVIALGAAGRKLHKSTSGALAEHGRIKSVMDVPKPQSESVQADYGTQKEIVSELRKELGEEFQDYVDKGLPKTEWVKRLSERLREALVKYEKVQNANPDFSAHWENIASGMFGGVIAGSATEQIFDSKIEPSRRGFLAKLIGYAGGVGGYLYSKQYHEKNMVESLSQPARLAALQAFELIPSEQNSEVEQYPESAPKIKWPELTDFIARQKGWLEDHGLPSRLDQYAAAHFTVSNGLPEPGEGDKPAPDGARKAGG